MAEDLSKLPRWARDRIERLEGSLRHERKKNAIVDAGESDTWIETNIPEFGAKTFLPNGAKLNFKTKDGVVAIRVIQPRNHDQGSLNVQGDSTIVVKPIASNMVHLYVER